MADLDTLFQTVDKLNRDDLNRLYAYIVQRRRIMKWWVVPQENIARLEEIMRPIHEEAAMMSDDEINAAIDEAIAGARREQSNSHRD